MKRIHLMVMCAATAGLASVADAQSRPVGGGARISFPSQSNLFSWERGHGFHGGFGGGVWIVEREVPVVVEKEVVREVAAPAPVAPPTPRKPFGVGNIYASLAGGCMKLIEDGASYYYCGGGEWYQQIGQGRSARYKAIARKL
jgi:hypothetical protein